MKKYCLNMRRFVLYILFVCAFFLPASGHTQNSQTTSLVNTRPAFIRGLIKRYQADANNRFITIRTHTLNGTTRDTSLFIQNDGSFSVKLIQEFEGDISLLYEDVQSDFYYKPGDSLKIVIDEAKWKKLDHKNASVYFSGKGATVSNLIGQF